MIIIVADRQLEWRTLHTNQIIGDDLIIWDSLGLSPKLSPGMRMRI